MTKVIMRAGQRGLLAAIAAALLAACGSTPSEAPPPASPIVQDDQAALAIAPGYKIGKPYRIAGQSYRPAEDFELVQQGIASWYGPGFHGRLTANGERYDMNAMTAAHRTLQLPSVVVVENLDNGSQVIVRVNDRGPYVDNRVIDLSQRAARALNFDTRGLARVRIAVLPDESRRMTKMAKDRKSVREMNAFVAELNANPPASVSRAAALPSPRPAAIGGAGWFLQAGAFGNPSYAERARDRLRGIGPVQISTVDRGDRTLYRVRLGPYPGKSEASAALKRVREVGFESAILLARS